MKGPRASCPENSTSEEPFPVPAANAIARPGDGQAGHGRDQQHPPLDMRPEKQPEPSDPGAERGSDHPDRQRPQNSPPVGDPTWGRLGIASENVPSPVQASRPMKMSEPTPAARRPGTRTSSSMAPAIPDASMRRKAASSGEPNSVLIAAKLPAAATIGAGPGRSVPLGEPDGADGKPAAERDQRRLGPQHYAEAQRGQCRERHPGKLDRQGRALPALNPSAGEWPPVPGR